MIVYIYVEGIIFSAGILCITFNGFKIYSVVLKPLDQSNYNQVFPSGVALDIFVLSSSLYIVQYNPNLRRGAKQQPPVLDRKEDILRLENLEYIH